MRCCDLKQFSNILNHLKFYVHIQVQEYIAYNLIYHFHRNANNQYNDNSVHNHTNNEIINKCSNNEHGANNFSNYHNNKFVSSRKFPSNFRQNRIR